MNSIKWTFLAPIAALAMTVQIKADDPGAHHQPKHHQYKLQQVTTAGGPSSSIATGPDNFLERYWNGHGTTVGLTDTASADPLSPNCFYSDCMVTNAFTFDLNGALTILPSLPGGSNSSVGYGINNDGLVVGVSSTGQIDPATGLPETHAVVWIDGQIIDLGTLGGASSQAFAVNDAGVVVGSAANGVPDASSGGIGPCTGWNCWGVSTQQRAFRWKDGQMEDLGTLGGPDAVAYFLNNHGHIAGVSYTNDTPNATTGYPTQDPFLWDKGTMTDLGGLGGTFGVVAALNNQGQVTGFSNLVGDQAYHPFLWSNGTMTDLGTLGGATGYAYALSDTGSVVGQAQTTGNATSHAFLWRGGIMTDLGALSSDLTGNSEAYGVNARDQVVGYADVTAAPGITAFLWEKGEMVDLNTLVKNPPAGLHLLYGYAINDKGEILALASLGSGGVAVTVLTEDGECDATCEAQAGLVTSATPVNSGAGSGKGN